MKRAFLVVMMLVASVGVQGQDCNVLVLPKFHYDTVRMSQYPQGKIDYFCEYARAAFYESDTIPAGAEVLSISVIQDKHTGSYLPNSVVIDMSTFSYYAYTFESLQLSTTDREKTYCFLTPSSTHPYLVLRSLNAMLRKMVEDEQSR